MKQVHIDNFNQTVTSDIYSGNGAAQITHFKVEGGRLVPHRDMEAEDNATIQTWDITDFCVGLDQAAPTVYGIGVTAAASNVEVYMKDATDEGSAITSAWDDAGTDNASSSGTKIDGCVVNYKNYLYGFQSDGVWKFGDITAAPASRVFTEPAGIYALNQTNVAQGLVGEDDIMYLPYDNKIFKLNDTTPTAAALTLASDQIITAIAEYGSYLAIATKSKNKTNVSRLYLWDRSSADVTENINWGTGELKYIGVVDGILVGVSYEANTEFNERASIVIRQLNGAPQVVQQIFSESNTLVPGHWSFTAEDKLYFGCKITLNGSTQEGVWTVRNDNGIKVNLEHRVDNDTALTSGTQGAIKVGDYLWVAFNDGDINRTNDQAFYTATSIYESAVFSGDNTNIEKQLNRIFVEMEPLPTAGQVVLKYRKDSNIDGGSWTTIFTETTDNANEREAFEESDGTNFGSFNDIQFRLESTGGAVITGFGFDYEELA